MQSEVTISFPGLHPGYGDTMTDLNIVALVSVGAHPTSARPRRAEQDARAVELGLRLAGQSLQLLHAGDPQAEALRAEAAEIRARHGIVAAEPSETPGL